MLRDTRRDDFEEYLRFLSVVVNFQEWLQENTPDTLARDQAILKITEARLWAAEAISKGIKE